MIRKMASHNIHSMVLPAELTGNYRTMTLMKVTVIALTQATCLEDLSKYAVFTAP